MIKKWIPLALCTLFTCCSLAQANKLYNYEIDLPTIQKAGILRVITQVKPNCYTIENGELIGFEAEWTQMFADSLGVKLLLIPVTPDEDPLKWLKQGKGDLIAGCVPTPKHAIPGFEFCHPYGDLQTWVVSKKGIAPVETFTDLTNHTIRLPSNSPLKQLLKEKARENNITLSILPVPPNVNWEKLQQRIVQGLYDLTCIETAHNGLLEGLQRTIALTEPKSYTWLVRSNQPELKAAIDTFFDEHYREKTYNILLKRYFGAQASEATLEPLPVISTYDDLLRKHAETEDFKWTLLAAQIYTESRFDARAASPSGAVGLMQIMPKTAKDLGIINVVDPDLNITGGVTYLQQQQKRIQGNVDDFNRLCFALASYNGGYGHLLDARKLAEKIGKNPDVWFGNVAAAYRVLKDHEHASELSYGRCDGNAIADYVNNIMLRYLNYELYLRASRDPLAELLKEQPEPAEEVAPEKAEEIIAEPIEAIKAPPTTTEAVRVPTNPQTLVIPSTPELPSEGVINELPAL